MSGSSPEEVRKAVRTYIGVFLSLMVLTVVTVAVAYIHLESVAVAVTIALIVASIKGTLVAGFFMHLFDERKTIYWVLALTVAFFIVLLLYPTLTILDAVEY